MLILHMKSPKPTLENVLDIYQNCKTCMKIIDIENICEKNISHVVEKYETCINKMFLTCTKNIECATKTGRHVFK